MSKFLSEAVALLKRAYKLNKDDMGFDIDVTEFLEKIEQYDECEECHGEGTVPGKTGGYEGIPEADVEFVCNECGGSGKINK